MCVLVVVALAVQAPAADSLRLLARQLPASALAVEARAQPGPVREATSAALAATDIDAARALASAYAAAWGDSFLLREVARFAAWPRERRAAKLAADSMRRAGVAVYGRDGPATAIAIWRRALTRAAAIPDTAGMAAIAGNLGAGFVAEGQPDSAQRYLERAQFLAAAVGDIRVEANAVGSLADASADRGDLAAARQGYAHAQVLRERIGDTRGLASIYNNLGLLAQQVGDRAEARRQFEAALALNRRDGRDVVAATNLVNLAGLASLDGDFARAEQLYRDALATWRAQELWADAAVALHGLGQLELRRGDYPAAQIALGEALEIYDQTGPLSEALAVRRQLAAALAAAGDLQGALDTLRRAQDGADSARAPPATRAGVALTRADLAAQLNARADAERWYARAEFLYRQAGDRAGEAEAQQGRGMLFLQREDYPRAQALFERALRAEELAGNERSAALVRLSLGLVARSRNDVSLARRELGRAAADLDRLGDPVGAAAALGERAALEAAAGNAAVAESLYGAALGRVEGRVAPDVVWRLHAGLALARRALGAPDDAARALRAAAAQLEHTGRSLALAERRSAFFADKWDVYVQLALTEQSRGLTGAAFAASEELRAREMAELLARGRVAAPATTSAELVEREQDLRRRIIELSDQIQSGAGGTDALRGPDLSLAAGPTRNALLRAQEQYTELLLELRERAPRHAELLAPAPPPWRRVANRLTPGEALVQYLVSDSGSLAFVLTRDTIVPVDLGTTRRDLARLIDFTRGTLEEPRPRLGGEDSLWRGPLRRLHSHLIAPLERTGLLNGITRLVLVPHAELHYLPFAALLEQEPSGRFLVERYELTETPSASVWLALSERAPEAHGAGALALAPRADVLRATRTEVATVARLVGGTRVLTNAGATEAALRRHGHAYRVLHLATYGILNKQNPLFSFVELAPGDDDDGRLEVHEVFGLALSADLVVLSACQTGLGSGALADVPPGDDWVGLTRAFLHAGARHVVATLWPVEDLSTAALMERFYEDYAVGSDPVRALARAQRALLAEAASGHPFHWAGFVGVGAR